MTKRRRGFVGMAVMALLVQGLPIPALSQSGKLYPVDEGPRDRSFTRFRQRLLQAARLRNRRYIWSIVDPRIECSFGDAHGKKDFIRMWGDRESGLEEELITLLSLGGEFVGKGEFCAPYVFTRFPDKIDAFDYQAIIGRNVRVRSRPSRTAPVLGVLSYDIVKASASEPVRKKEDRLEGVSYLSDSLYSRDDWMKVITPQGRTGYVAARYVRSPIDYRACFKKRHGRWWMTALVAGD
jgi:hypothetical protein